MPRYELVEYKTYSQDQNDPLTKYNPMASAIIRIDDRFCVTYVQKKNKDGGLYWSIPSVGVGEAGVKKYLDIFAAERRSEDKALMDFVKDSVRALGSSLQFSAMAASEGGASNEQLPF